MNDKEYVMMVLKDILNLGKCVILRYVENKCNTYVFNPRASS